MRSGGGLFRGGRVASLMSGTGEPRERAGVEIERKFLVASLPAEFRSLRGVDIRQGYLAVEGGVEVRVRAAGDERWLTVKGEGAGIGAGVGRREVEVPLGRAVFEALWAMTDGRRLEKRRVRVGLAGEVVAEVDVYGGRLAGLVVVEVEFADAGEAGRFDPPAWFGREVTGEAGYRNRVLAECGVAGAG